MTRAIALLAALAVPSAATASDTSAVTPAFVEETAASGLAHSFTGDWEYIVGGGVAAFDCSGDGLPELALAGGERPAQLFLNASEDGGALRFMPAPADAGLSLDAVSGIYPLDADSDGITDLFLLRVGENVALRGLGGCRFERANEAWGFDGGDGWSTAFAATWEKGAAWPTVAIGNYIDRREEDFPWGSCTDNWLHRPGTDGAGFAPPLPLTPSYCALSMLFTDWNGSGQPALRVSNDREYYKGGEEQLWHIAPGEAPRLYARDEGWKQLRIWGMGIAAADLTGDGLPEYALTSMADNKLQTLANPHAGSLMPVYDDVAFRAGVTAHRPYTGGDIRPSTAWHAEFEDVNNDGRADLFFAKGNVSDMPDFAIDDPDNLLVQETDGTFRETGAEAGVASMAAGRGAALADLNADGLVDLVVVNRNAPAQVWRNVTEGAGNWVQVALRQDAPNTEAIGARVEIRREDRTETREVTRGGGHAGDQAVPIHVGLGKDAQAEVRVIWPDGTEGPWETLPQGAVYVLRRDAPAEPLP